MNGLRGPPGSTGGGVVYTRWGRTTCPSTSGTQLLYAGRAAGSLFSQVEVEQTTSVYQSSHRTPLTLLGHRVEEHTCMGLSMRLQVVIMDHFILLLNTMSHVQCVTLQHEELL